MPLVPSGIRALAVPWSVAAAILSASGASASAGGAAQRAEHRAQTSGWACRLIPAGSVRPVVEEGMQRSETIRRQCEELAAARAIVVLEWGDTGYSQLHAMTAMAVRDGVVVARVKLPPLGDIVVLMAHELQHVIEQTRGLDLRAEANRDGSGVWRALGEYYETQAAVDVGRQVAAELRAYSKGDRHHRR